MLKYAYKTNMARLSTQHALRDAPLRLAELLSVPAKELKVRREVAVGDRRIDWVASIGKQTFLIEGKADGIAATVALVARQVRQSAEAWGKNAVPLVVVPYMGDAGERLCREEGVSWFDLSGNAQIVVPGLRVQIEGKPNRFKRPGRPKSLFASKSARIARWLLMKSDQAFTQRELSQLSGLDEGFTSRIVRGLEEQRLITRHNDGKVQVADYATLLDAWREAYDFSKHHLVRGHIAARSGEDVLRRTADWLQREKIEYAATGLVGAWLWSGFAGFRLVTFYIDELPSMPNAIGFHETDRGANVWFVLPNDAGVFQGSQLREEITCVHPVQVYLDLKRHPERSIEAAEELRRKLPLTHA